MNEEIKQKAEELSILLAEEGKGRTILVTPGGGNIYSTGERFVNDKALLKEMGRLFKEGINK